MRETIKHRLVMYASTKGLRDYELEQKIGMSNGVLRRFESDVKGTIVATALEVFPDISPDWLLTGRGSMLRSNLKPIAEGDDDYALDGGVVAEPTAAYHGVKSKDITLPVRVYEEMLHQLKVKDQQLEDAAAQIRTLFEMINTH